jgi:hypothetical protein
MAGKIPGKSNDGERKIMKETIIITMVGAAAVVRAIMAEDEAEEADEVVTEDTAAIAII